MSYQTQTIEEVDSPATRERILELFRANRIPDPEERYAWLYRSKSYGDKLYTRVLLHQDRIVGISTLMRVDHAGLSLGCLVNLIVDEEHRTLGPALILEKQLLSLGCELLQPDLLITNPNRKADILPRRLGFQRIGQFTRYSWIANPAAYARLPEGLQKLTGQLARALLIPWLQVHAISASMKGGGCPLSDWQFFDRIADVASALPPYQHWRHVERPSSHDRIAFMGPPAAGNPYVIFGLGQNGVCFLSELHNMTEDCMESALATFMAQALKRYPIRNFALSLSNSPRLQGALSNLGFLTRIDGSELNLYLSNCNSGDKPSIRQRLGETPLFPSIIDF